MIYNDTQSCFLFLSFFLRIYDYNNKNPTFNIYLSEGEEIKFARSKSFRLVFNYLIVYFSVSKGFDRFDRGRSCILSSILSNGKKREGETSRMIDRILRDRCNEFSLDGLKPPWGDRLVTLR